ncbi:MAG: 4Fe-4S dicluster domain-containing protein [Candidatus Helarchaeota archaeon]
MDFNPKDLIRKVEVPNDYIQYNIDNCVGCGNCNKVCPVNLWQLKEINSEKKAFLRDDYKKFCLECMACWQVCEHDAITFNHPKGGTGIIYNYG